MSGEVVPGTGEAFAHQPVMAREVLELLAGVPPGLVVDGTVGGGGHARLLLEARPDISVLGIDRDGDAVAAARARLEPYGQRARVVRGGFEDMARIVATEGEGNLMGVLFDLGVSSPQLDRAARGFSYMADAPLDMRMDSRQALTAAIVVNTYDEQQLAEIIKTYGEERFARQIAARIVARRPIDTTSELVDVIRQAIPASARRPGPNARAGRRGAPGSAHVPGHPHGSEPRAAEPRRRARRVGPPARAGRPRARPRVSLTRGPHGEGALRRVGEDSRRRGARSPGRARGAARPSCGCSRGRPRSRPTRRSPPTRAPGARDCAWPRSSRRPEAAAVPSATKAPPRPRRAPARARTPSTATPPPRRKPARSLPARASLIAPQTRPRPPVRTPGPASRRARRPPVEAPRRATRPEQRHPPGAARPGARRRLAAVVVCGVVIVLTIVAFHAVLAQNQMKIDEMRGEIAVAESRYEEARYENSVLASPERITERAMAIGLMVPAGAPVAVPLIGAVPKRGSSSDAMSDWAEVKGHLNVSRDLGGRSGRPAPPAQPRARPTRPPVRPAASSRGTDRPSRARHTRPPGARRSGGRTPHRRGAGSSGSSRSSWWCSSSSRRALPTSRPATARRSPRSDATSASSM